MNRMAITLLFMVAFSGCGASPEVVPEATETPGAPPVQVSMTSLAATQIGPFEVQVMFEETIEDGHFNIRITGGEVAAVREWVGPEDASGVVVVKTEIENDYHHGHVEMPSPVPADARLWIEIETPEGEHLKGSVPLR